MCILREVKFKVVSSEWLTLNNAIDKLWNLIVNHFYSKRHVHKGAQTQLNPRISIVHSKEIQIYFYRHCATTDFAVGSHSSVTCLLSHVTIKPLSISKCWILQGDVINLTTFYTAANEVGGKLVSACPSVCTTSADLFCLRMLWIMGAWFFLKICTRITHQIFLLIG